MASVYAMANAWVYPASVKTNSWNWDLKTLLAQMPYLVQMDSNLMVVNISWYPHLWESNLLAYVQKKTVCPKMVIAALPLIKKQIIMNK